jgi:hypothetical protein
MRSKARVNLPSIIAVACVVEPLGLLCVHQLGLRVSAQSNRHLNSKGFICAQ